MLIRNRYDYIINLLYFLILRMITTKIEQENHRFVWHNKLQSGFFKSCFSVREKNNVASNFVPRGHILFSILE